MASIQIRESAIGKALFAKHVDMGKINRNVAYPHLTLFTSELVLFVILYNWIEGPIDRAGSYLIKATLLKEKLM